MNHAPVNFSRTLLAAAMTSVLLTACGGGGGDDSASNTPPPTTTSTITGTASKGILQHAIVSAFKVTDDGKKGDFLSQTTTDTNGAYTLTVTGYNGAVLLEMTSDTNTKMVCDIPTGCDGAAFGSSVSANLTLQTVLPELQADNKTAITPFTHLAAKFAANKGLNKANIEAALSQIADLFGLPHLNATTPVNAAGDLGTASPVEQNYAVMNAAIGELADNVADISAKLDALAQEINTKGGQLQSSEAGSINTKLDLADVLAAAQAVSLSPKLKNLNSGIRTLLANKLELAKQNQGNTTAVPATGSGSSDLAKAKLFVESASQLLSTLQQYDDQSFLDSLQSKAVTIRNLANGEQMIADALGATVTVLAHRVSTHPQPGVVGKTAIDAILAEQFNASNLVATIANDGQLTINADHTATLSGELSLQRKKVVYQSVPYTAYQLTPTYGLVNGNYQITGYQNLPYTAYNSVRTVENDGPAQAFTVSNFKIHYPADAAVGPTFTLAIDAGSKIKTANLELSLAANSDSKIAVTFGNNTTWANHVNAAQEDSPAASHLPTRVNTKLDRLTLKALKAGNAEISQFVGSLSLNTIQAQFDTTTGDKRRWPLPELATLSGAFSSGAGDIVEATATVDLADSNPKVSPEEGKIRTGLYEYRYNASNNSIILKPALGTIGLNRATQLDLTLGDCGNGQKRLLSNHGQIYLGYNCSTQTDVAEFYKAFISNGHIYPFLSEIDGEGSYLPQYPANFNYKSTSAKLNGILSDSEGSLSEDATHLGKGAITVNSKIKLLGNAAADIDAQVTAKYTGQHNGDVMAELRVGTDKLRLQSSVVGGQPMITLSNKDNVSVEANISGKEKKIELKVNGVVQGWIYKLNGLPVAKFNDNSLRAL